MTRSSSSTPARALVMLLAASISASCSESPGAAPVAALAPESAAPAPAGDLQEQPDLAGDFDLLDPAELAAEHLDGVIPTLSDLPVPLTRRTMRYVESFATTEKGRKTFAERFHRASKLRAHLEQQFRQRGLAEDLVWLVAVESGFSPQAASSAGAVGLFQLMPATATRYGLAVDDELDERRSITRSTEAAISYLVSLHARFGTWDLALAAYNCGSDRVDQALVEARRLLSRKDDAAVALHELAELSLVPRETAHFVPMIHAFAIVAHNRQLLGLEDPEPFEPMRFAEVAIAEGTRMSVIAKAADVSIATLREYNPDLLTDRLPEGRGDHLVQIPVDSLEQTLAALPALIARDQGSPAAAIRLPAPAVELSGAELAAAKSKKRSRKSKDGAASSGAVTLEPSTARKGAYVLPNGLYVELEEQASGTIELGARVEVLDPTSKRKPIGHTLRLEDRQLKPTELAVGLANLRRDLQRLVFGDAAHKLREHLVGRRRGFYDKTGFGDLFAGLSERVFPEGHPMHGGLLVGSTEPADDLFLEPEPIWAFDITLTVRGALSAEQLAEPLHAALAAPLAPLKAPPVASASRIAVSDGGRRLLIGWASAPLREADETAAHLALILACQPRLGRAHIALRQGKSIAAGVSCALELGAQATVGWILAQPIEPSTALDAEMAIDAAIGKLITSGPTDVELESARVVLRTELAREREMARMRGLPRNRVIASSERILGKLTDVDTVDVTEAAKALFSKDHRVVVTGG